MIKIFKSFAHSETGSGIFLLFAAAIALICANSPIASFYQTFIDIPLQISIGNFAIAKPLLLWVNDGLMAIFFFVVGLELKRELYVGELSNKKNIALPALGAVGGMIVPAAIYLAFNRNDSIAIQGWAIPAATDIAFALGLLSLLGKRVPHSLKIFVVSLAIFDDIGAIIIIAIFYTAKLSLTALAVAALCLVVLTIQNRYKVTSLAPYVVVGLIMWVALLKSGVHATLAGVLLAMFIPLKDPKDPDHSPLINLEKDLHGTVAFFVLPVFAFANSGVTLFGEGAGEFIHPVPLGILFGLFFGKQIGIMLFCALGIVMRIAQLPADIKWRYLYGAAILCGIGFTMSLFIAGLAFENQPDRLFDERIGILAGSLLSGIIGLGWLNYVLPRVKSNGTTTVSK
ncbi:MAG: Na+/H+ antiporter NhaA [Pseudomonadota bacterium]